MLEATNLFLDPNLADTEDTCFEAINQLADQILELSKGENQKFSAGVYIWGTEEVARRILLLLEENNIPLLGVFDTDSRKIGTLFAGHIVTNPTTVHNFVIICSYHQPSHLQVARKLLGEYAIGAWELLISFRGTIYLPWNNLRSPSDLTENEKQKLIIIADRVHPDSKSEYWKQVAAHHFVGILNPNQSGSFSTAEEYFVPGIIETTNESIFLDLGAYTGDTIERFFAQEIGIGDSRKAIGIEADQSNFLTLMKKFISREDVILINSVISDESGLTPFSQSTNSMGSSALFFEPNTFVPAITIDQIHQQMKFSHVKFDIEGFERRALQGASEAIRNGKAIWSVASYHLFDDFWVLPSFFPDDYLMFVTRHTPLPWDTTFHFIKS
jgi:FkbM family methyltransferase